jgi:hypothetical protein
MFVSVTRLRIRSLWFMPAFLWMTIRSQRQLCRAPGFRGGRLLPDAKRTFWTSSVWENDKAMKAFRGSGAHAAAMPKLAEWCDEASYGHWEVADGTVPEWPEVYDRMVKEGRLSRVAHPSPDHEARHFPPPRLSPQIGRELKPAH